MMTPYLLHVKEHVQTMTAASTWRRTPSFYLATWLPLAYLLAARGSCYTPGCHMHTVQVKNGLAPTHTLKHGTAGNMTG